MIKTVLSSIIVGATFAISPISFAAFPEKPITLIVGFSPGGTADGTARLLAESMGADLGQPIVVENRPGANGNIATTYVSRAKPDGYTVFLTSIGHTVNPSLRKSVSYDPVDDFSAIGLVLTAPNVLVVPQSSPFNNVQELIAYAKQNPGKLNVASSGTGTSVHLSAELFQTLTGTKLTHIPYKGTGSALPDLLAGTTQLMFPNIPSALPQVKGGGLKAFGVTSKERSAGAPDIPSLEEEGVAGYDLSTWYGMVGPAQIDPAVVAKLNQALQKALNDPSVREKLISRGADPAPSTSEEFEGFLKSETEKWRNLIKANNIQLD
jgi:tripartite-type tricarboxylate transporter receptor subunit TctC